MARNILTARSLDKELKLALAAATEKRTRVRVLDGDNLNLVVRANGGASWVLDYRLGGQRKPLTLGPWPALGLAEARELAAKARSDVARGIDPAEARKPARPPQIEADAPAPSDTVLQLMEDWLQKHRGSAVYKKNIRAGMVKDVLPAIGAKAPQDVTRSDILAVLRAMEARGALVMLRRVKLWLKHVFEFAIDDEARPAVVTSPVPTGHLASFMTPEEGHFAAITEADEIPELMRAIRLHDKPLNRAALLLSAYVFQRPTEIRKAKWSEFDLGSARWVIPANRMKRGREHWVPLATQVVALLRAHAGVVGTKGWLFPGRRYLQPMSEGSLKSALDGAGFRGRHTPHGFRAMAHTTLAERLEVDERIIEKQLSHEEENKVKRAYNRAEYWAQRVTMMQRWADFLDAQ